MLKAGYNFKGATEEILWIWLSVFSCRSRLLEIFSDLNLKFEYCKLGVKLLALHIELYNCYLRHCIAEIRNPHCQDLVQMLETVEKDNIF